MSHADLHIDFETRSVIDLRKHGLDLYSADASTEPTCLAMALGAQSGIGLWLPGRDLPAVTRAHVTAGGPVVAHNAPFEFAIWNRICVPRYGWPVLHIEQLRCTMAMAYAMGLPGALDDAAAALGLDVRKDHDGHRVMMQLCRPRKRWMPGAPGYDQARAAADYWRPYALPEFTVLPTGEVVQWWADPEKNAKLHSYCQRDVEVERALHQRMVELSPQEQRLWRLDQKINWRGVPADLRAVYAAIAVVDAEKGRMDKAMRQITNGAVEKCTQSSRLTDWLNAQGVFTPGVSKADVKELLDDDYLPGDLTAEVARYFGTERGIEGAPRQALKLRQEANRASSAKLVKMLDVVGHDGLLRFLFQYHAAATGRWGGRKVQPQNFPRPDKRYEDPEIQEAIIAMLVSGAGPDAVRRFFGAPMEVIASVMRGFLLPHHGRDLLVGDFSNIEGRVLPWLAGDERKLAIFRAQDDKTGPEVYIVAAAEMFGVDPATLTKKSPERQLGKVSELALGFNGGKGAFTAMAAVYGIYVGGAEAQERAIKSNGLFVAAARVPGIVEAWRDMHPLIAGRKTGSRGGREGGYWQAVEKAAITAVRNPGVCAAAGAPGREVTYFVNGSFLWARLPSGRHLCYAYPEIRQVTTPWGAVKEALTYKTVIGGNSAARSKIVREDGNTGKFARIAVHGGVLTENNVQAVARDCLSDALIRLDGMGLPICMHVHDEIVGDCAPDSPPDTLHHFERAMAQTEPWAAGLPVVVEAWRGNRYRK